MALLAAAIAVVVFHQPLLRLLASALVVDELADRVDVLVLPGQPREYDPLVVRYRAHPGCRLLLVQSRPDRLERLGVVPTAEEAARRELRARAVPDDALVTIPGGRPNDDWAMARAVRGWLDDHPGERAVVLADRFSSRYIQWALTTTLGGDAGRVAVVGVAHPWYDETNWWRRKEGVQAVVNGALRLAWAAAVGDSPDFGEADVELAPEAPR